MVGYNDVPELNRSTFSIKVATPHHEAILIFKTAQQKVIPFWSPAELFSKLEKLRGEEWSPDFSEKSYLNIEIIQANR